MPPAQGCARYRSQGRLSSRFVRLYVKSGQFVTSGLAPDDGSAAVSARQRSRLVPRRGRELTGVGRNFKGRLKRHGRIVNLADPERLFPARLA